MKIIHLSDTHQSHEATNEFLRNNKSEVLIHSGDISSRGELYPSRQFLKWYNELVGFDYKIFIAGNHDFCFEEKKDDIKGYLEEFPDLIYLENSSCEIDGIKFWGSPVTPWFHGWAFNVNRGPDIKKIWDEIPKDTNVLITHGPAAYIMDRTQSGLNVGCEDLRNWIKENKPKLHLFGHIHETYGVTADEHTLYSNASIMNLAYKPVNKPNIINI